MDKRQVMYDIERCISHVPDACRDCSHYTGTVGFGCMENLMTDALALLKEQEAVEPKVIMMNGFGHPVHACGKCGLSVTESMNYCSRCGQAVKWT